MTGRQIKSMRRKLNLTQTELGERLGVTRVAVAYWESGRRTPRGPALLMLREIEKKTKAVLTVA